MEKYVKPEISVIEIDETETILTSGTVEVGDGEYVDGENAIDWPFGA